MFPLFLKRTADVLALPYLCCISGGFFVRVPTETLFSCLAENRQMIPQNPKDPSSSFFDNYQPISTTPVMSIRLRWFTEQSGMPPTTQFAYQKRLDTCDAYLWVSRKVLWRVGRRLRFCRLTSTQPLIGSTIMKFSTSSTLRVLEILCCRYWHSFYQIDHSTL